ncbi:MAG TPA: hypothetical protein VGF48_15810 [Thermoanaerobaculia bacterium]
MKRMLLVMLFAVNAFAQRNPADYTRVLLPVHRSVSASYGGWTVQWHFRNEGKSAADVFPLAWMCGLPLPGPGVSIIGKPALPPERTMLCHAGDVIPSPLVPPSVPIVSDRPGAFLYVETAAIDQVTIGGSLNWVTFGSPKAAAPAQLRAVPEGEFLRGTRSILSVPKVSGSRYALRIYALPETAQGARVTVRVYDIRSARQTAEETLLSTTTLTLDPPTGAVAPCFGGCDLPAAGYLPATAQLFDFIGGGETSLRIEIEPDSDALRWWAVLSSTSVTNDVGIFTP